MLLFMYIFPLSQPSFFIFGYKMAQEAANEVFRYVVAFLAVFCSFGVNSPQAWFGTSGLASISQCQSREVEELLTQAQSPPACPSVFLSLDFTRDNDEYVRLVPES
jgi:hypothetical protein